jgi:hypothetical protein
VTRSQAKKIADKIIYRRPIFIHKPPIRRDHVCIVLPVSEAEKLGLTGPESEDQINIILQNPRVGNDAIQ